MSSFSTFVARQRWGAFVYHLLQALVSLAVGYGSGVITQWVLRSLVLNGGNWTPVLQEYIYGAFGHFLMAITGIFGVPLLHLGRSALIGVSWGRTLGAAILTGLCMAGGVALLFALLLDGRGIGFFIVSTLIFGAVTAGVAAVTFKAFTGNKRISERERTPEIAAAKRLGVGIAASAISGGTACSLLFVVSVLVDHQHSPSWWLPFYRFILIFLAAGWLVFGLPLVIFGPARRTFVLPLHSAMLGGAAGIAFLECYFETMFAGAGRSLSAVTSHICFDLLAFLLGAFTTYLYVLWTKKFFRHSTVEAKHPWTQ